MKVSNSLENKRKEKTTPVGVGNEKLSNIPGCPGSNSLWKRSACHLCVLLKQ